MKENREKWKGEGKNVEGGSTLYRLVTRMTNFNTSTYIAGPELYHVQTHP